ncbi:MAG: HepT-like ribonuclease domain-containing protein [Candidatus Dormibacteraceae bacterium]
MNEVDQATLALADMLFNARRAVDYMEQGGAEWYDDEMLLDAIAHRIRELTEAAKYRFPPTRQIEYPDLPWVEMIRTRDLFTHHYRKVDRFELRKIVEDHLPPLIAYLEALDIPDIE